MPAVLINKYLVFRKLFLTDPVTSNTQYQLDARIFSFDINEAVLKERHVCLHRSEHNDR